MFYDLQQDCDPIEARFGACIEDVVFFDPQKASPAQMENLSLSYAAQWEELARFWNDSVKLSVDGEFPMPSQNWGHFTLGEDQNGKIVSVDLNENENFIILKVSDEGDGFKESDIKKVFDRFYSNRPDNFGEHSGLGLNIVKNLVQIHKGEIDASNSPKGGAVIQIKFPKNYN